MRGWPKDEQRAVFQPVGVALFLIGAAWLGGSGTVDRASLELFLIGLPGVLVGTWLGLRLYGRLDEAAFRKVVLVVLLISGVADRKSTRLNSSHVSESRMPSSA